MKKRKHLKLKNLFSLQLKKMKIVLLIFMFISTSFALKFEKKIFETTAEKRIYEVMTKHYNDADLAYYILFLCREFEKESNWKYNKAHCLKLSFWVAKAESTRCQFAAYNNCWWLMPRWRLAKYSDKFEAFRDWARRYKKYWYKSTPYDLYWRDWKPWKNRYCTEELSSWTHWWCPNWLKHSLEWWRLIQKVIDEVHLYAKK